MANGRRESLGDFETAVLLAVAHLEADAYGVTIHDQIESRTGRTISIGSLYTALDRLERKGFVTSTMSDPTPERGGRSKRHFRITELGARGLRQSREFLDRMWAGVRLRPQRGHA